MKKFSYFLLIAILSLFTTNNSFAITTPTNSFATLQQSECIQPIFTDHGEVLSVVKISETKINSTEHSTSDSSDFISGNLTLLYSLCVALVLFNLLAQIKIIIQMVHLFFQFQKMDEFA